MMQADGPVYPLLKERRKEALKHLSLTFRGLDQLSPWLLLTPLGTFLREPQPNHKVSCQNLLQHFRLTSVEEWTEQSPSPERNPPAKQHAALHKEEVPLC